MPDLAELQRLTEEAADEAEGDWFDPALLEPGAPDISASIKARRFMQAFDPDTAKKLIAVALAAQECRRAWDVFEATEVGDFNAQLMLTCEAADEALRKALEELAGSPQERRE